MGKSELSCKDRTPAKPLFLNRPSAIIVGMTRPAAAPAFAPALAIAVALALSACGRAPPAGDNLDSLDAELTNGNATGNAVLTGALRDQIMVDPKLAQSSNANAVRPPNRPLSGVLPGDDVAAGKGDGVDPKSLKAAPAPTGDCPECRTATGAVTLGALAERQKGARAHCVQAVRYSAVWATRLPAAVPLYPDARVTEAAGTDAAGCALRVVSFATTAPVSRVIDWYYTRTTGAGYSAEHKADGARHVLGGTKGDAAYIIYAEPRGGGGTSVDLIAN